ncbi:MAG TPA: MmgE/PrpD family protein [Candidatus Binatia bacterium]|jgi:2-methylcitrate dehydratase PrpD
MDVTKKIAEFVASARYEAMPPKALENAKAAALDCLGVALAGSRDECAGIAAGIARRERAVEETSVWGQGFRSSALAAAFANGVAAHALDFDHSFTMMGQPTAPILPAIFSLGESLGASGRQIIEAYVAGFETTAKLVFALRDTAEDGWHAPGILGALGAAAASAKLLRLDPPRIEMALGITASMAGGVVCNFGTMTKPLHVGAGARNGILAAHLAEAGYTANARAIEASVGLCEMFYRMPPDEKPLAELGESYALATEGIRIKPYPCGGLTHQAIGALLDLRAEHGITAEAVEAIEVDVTQHTFERIAFRIPQNGIQGKFSMNYVLARALIDGHVSLDAFTDEAVRDGAVLRLAERVDMKLDNKLKKSNAGGRPCRVTVRLKNGAMHSRAAEHAKGGPELPMTADERRAKFTECARRVLDEGAVRRAMEAIEGLETLEDIRPLCGMMMG